MIPLRALGREALDGARPVGEAGIRVADREDGVVVEEVSPGSPASRQGLQPGDRILAVGGRDIDGLGSAAAGLLLRGPIGSTVEVNLVGRGRSRRTVTLERSAMKAVMASGR
jgi:carboxyl-terminal processing protease